MNWIMRCSSDDITYTLNVAATVAATVAAEGAERAEGVEIMLGNLKKKNYWNR